MTRLPAATPWSWPDYLVALLLAGYMTMGRQFAHLGVPPLFVGEAAFGLYFLARARSTFAPLLGALAHPSQWSPLAWALYASLSYGVLEVIRGLGAGHNPMITLQNLVFHVYPLFLFVGWDVGRRHGDFLRRLVVPLAWLNGVYGVLYVCIFGPAGWTDKLSMQADDRGLFGQPNWTAVVLLSLAVFEPRWQRRLAPLALNTFVLLAMQTRSEWLGITLCMALWAFLTGRFGPVLKLAGGVAALLVVGLVADVRLPSPASRGGGEISSRELIARATAAVSPRLASTISPDAAFYVDTINWRTKWWQEIWEMVHDRPERVWIGPAYGYPIWELHPEGTDNVMLRTPHNAVIYALGYTGWLGVALFGLLQLAVLVCLWRHWQQTRQAYGLCVFVICAVRWMFDIFFESPQFAIVYFLLVGLALADEGGASSSSRESAMLEGVN